MSSLSNTPFAINCIRILEQEKAKMIALLKNTSVGDKWIIIISTINDLASTKYIFNKKKILTSLGLKVKVKKEFKITASELTSLIEKLNSDDNVLGIIIQYPVVTRNRASIINLINPFKDLDALHDFWFEQTKLNKKKDQLLMPPTAYAIKQILEDKKPYERLLQLKNKQLNIKVVQKILTNQILKIHVIGRSQLTGMPIITYLKNAKHMVTSADINTDASKKITRIKKADIVICTAGGENIIDEKILKNGQIIIDFGRFYKNNKPFGSINNNQLPYGVIHTTLFKGTGYATLAGLIHNIRISIERKLWRRKWK